MGRGLASAMNRAIDRIDGSDADDRSRADVVAQLSTAMGIDESTVNEILNASIDCPPVDRINRAARVNGMPSAESLRTAGRGDGCNY